MCRTLGARVRGREGAGVQRRMSERAFAAESDEIFPQDA